MAVSGFTRREFTLALAGGTAITASQQASAVGQESKTDNAEKTPTKDTEKTAENSDKTPDKKPDTDEVSEPPPEAAYLLGLIMRRYPDERLDETAVTGIVRDIYGDLARSRVLSSFPLENSDEPGFTFKA